jgi:uncharacterized membrane protein
MVPLTLWAAIAWTAAINGVFRTGASPLPLLPSAIFLPVIIGAPLPHGPADGTRCAQA